MNFSIKALWSNPLSHRKSDSGYRTVVFFFILSLFILWYAPLTISQSADITLIFPQSGSFSSLDSFSLISPQDADSVKITPTHKTIAFNWQASASTDPDDTVRYDFYLSRTPDFGADTIVYRGLLDTTYRNSTDFTHIGDLKLWYWKVKAYDKSETERWSDQTWSFYVYLCGDYNGDEKINVTDIVYAINYLFRAGAEPKPFIAGDVNCDGRVTVSDVLYLVNYLFMLAEPCKNCP